jgi:flagellar hook assembly protein FlgD
VGRAVQHRTASRYRAQGNFPNPFKPQTTVAFSLSAADASQIVSLKVYNVRGSCEDPVNERLGEGDHQIVWQGTDDSERQVSSGVYFTRLVTPARPPPTRRLLLK